MRSAISVPQQLPKVRGLRVLDTSLALSIKTERGRGGTIEDVAFDGVHISGTGCSARRSSRAEPHSAGRAKPVRLKP